MVILRDRVINSRRNLSFKLSLVLKRMNSSSHSFGTNINFFGNFEGSCCKCSKKLVLVSDLISDSRYFLQLMDEFLLFERLCCCCWRKSCCLDECSPLPKKEFLRKHHKRTLNLILYFDYCLKLCTKNLFLVVFLPGKNII